MGDLDSDKPLGGICYGCRVADFHGLDSQTGSIASNITDSLERKPVGACGQALPSTSKIAAALNLNRDIIVAGIALQNRAQPFAVGAIIKEVHLRKSGRVCNLWEQR